MVDKKRKAAIIQLFNQTWQPHDGQIKVGKQVFDNPADLVYVDCGRKFGKTALGVYMILLWAATHENSEIYYLAPSRKLARELVWTNRRIMTCDNGDPDFLDKLGALMGGEIRVRDQEMRVMFPNGSFIAVDGSNNINNQLGLKPDFMVCDEFKAFKDRWFEFMRPNMAAKKGKMLFITTPPDTPNQAYELSEECRTGMKNGDNYYYYLNMPSSTNSMIPDHKEWLAREKIRLLKAGRENEWIREYEATFILNNEHGVIPQLNRTNSVSLKDLDYGEDPELLISMCLTNTTVMSALISIYNAQKGVLMPITEVKVWDSKMSSLESLYDVLKEKYEEVRSKSPILPDIEKATVLLSPRDEWARTQLQVIAPGINHTQIAPKELIKLEYRMPLMKDLINRKKLLVSDNCDELIKEGETYTRSEITYKVNSGHPRPLVDCLRYQSDFLAQRFDEYHERIKHPTFLEKVEQDWIDKDESRKADDWSSSGSWLEF